MSILLSGSGAAPPNAAPVAHITNPTCTGLACSFTGTTSSDPDGDTLSYSWNFGDGTAASTTPNPSHSYATAGARTVTLTVNDGHGHSATDTTSVNPSGTAPVSNVAFVGANSSNGNRTIHTTALPSGVQAGDTLVAFFTANGTTPTYTPPAGWTLLETKDGNGIVTAGVDEDGDGVRHRRERHVVGHLQVRPHRGRLPRAQRHHADRGLCVEDRQRRRCGARQPGSDRDRRLQLAGDLLG